MKDLLIMSFALVLLIFSGCAQSGSEAKTDEAKAGKVRVATVQAKKENYAPKVSFGGTFKHFREANLSGVPRRKGRFGTEE